MDTSPQIQMMPSVAQLLVKEQLLDLEQTETAIERANENNIPLVFFIVENEIIDADIVANLLAKDFGVPLFDLDCFDRECLPLDIVNDRLISKHKALPLFARGDHLFIAIADPSNQIGLDEIKFQTGMSVHGVVVEANKLNDWIKLAISAKESESLDDFLSDTYLDEIDISNDEKDLSEEDFESADDAPVVKFVFKVLLDAIHKSASDIHFEPYEKTYRVRFRQDGVLHEVAAPPITLASRIAARLKVMSRLDISERRIPQDGRFKMNISRHQAIDFRLSTCPTVNGEKIVMRILDPEGAKLGIQALGFEEEQEKLFLKHIEQPQGMILVTGPTGSGKTVTLYTALNLLNVTERNISTAEDPVEIKLNGVNQVNINIKTGLTFPKALRSFLRQDPDIIMIGEMRDLETAEIGIKAAQTGHMVLSTLHTNSAPETLTRLVNMGIPAYNIASSVSLIIAQRLARRLCKKCKTKTKIPREELLLEGFSEEDVDDLVIYKPKGCATCTGGYKGRVGLFELLEVTKDLGDLIMEGGGALEIAKHAEKEGMQSIRKTGLKQIMLGVTSLEEINRVTKD